MTLGCLSSVNSIANAHMITWIRWCKSYVWSLHHLTSAWVNQFLQIMKSRFCHTGWHGMWCDVVSCGIPSDTCGQEAVLLACCGINALTSFLVAAWSPKSRDSSLPESAHSPWGLSLLPALAAKTPACKGLPWPWFSPNLQGCAESSSLTRPCHIN